MRRRMRRRMRRHATSQADGALGWHNAQTHQTSHTGVRNLQLRQLERAPPGFSSSITTPSTPIRVLRFRFLLRPSAFVAGVDASVDDDHDIGCTASGSQRLRPSQTRDPMHPMHKVRVRAGR
eukprot:2699446-Rhodomonas_salina.3